MRTLEADPCDDEVATAAPAPFASGVPHLPQKSDVGGFSAPHFAQCFASAFPHFAQKLSVEELFVPHFEQRIDVPRDLNDRPLLYHPASARDQQATEGRLVKLVLLSIPLQREMITVLEPLGSEHGCWRTPHVVAKKGLVELATPLNVRRAALLLGVEKFLSVCVYQPGSTVDCARSMTVVPAGICD
jgi:hypothetical protein